MTRLDSKYAPSLILLAVFGLQWLLLFTLQEPTWDAVSYYAYARSLAFDQDLDFANDYRLSYPTAGEHFASRSYDEQLTPHGRVANLFAVGASVLWLPWLAVLRAAAAAGLTGVGDAAALTGYERIFVGNIAALSALLGLGAYWLSMRLAQEAAGRVLALASVVTLMFATPLLYYQYREPLYSHTAAAFTVALAVFLWWRWQEAQDRRGAALILGAALGLAGLVRWQNLIYLALPLVSSALLVGGAAAGERGAAAKKTAVDLLLVGVGALAVFSLQMAVWRVLYGSFLTIPQGESFLDWRARYLLPLLFSSFRGLLPWMPVFFLAAAGLLALSKRSPALGLPLLVMLLLALYVNGSTRDWFAGGGYGPRRLTSELVLLVVGYAAFLQLLPERGRKVITAVLGTLLALQQWLLLRYGLAPGFGGRVMSMMPTFAWEDVPLSSFAGDLLGYLPAALAQPLDFLVLSGSPLDSLFRQNVFPWMHVGTLIATSLFVGVMLMLGLWLWRRAGAVWVVLGGAFLLLLANFWIVLRA